MRGPATAMQTRSRYVMIERRNSRPRTRCRYFISTNYGTHELSAISRKLSGPAKGCATWLLVLGGDRQVRRREKIKLSRKGAKTQRRKEKPSLFPLRLCAFARHAFCHLSPQALLERFL